ncbi:MAG: outer membrane protein assembly factor BamD [Bacteroidales bacterium]|jgi:outer membrane protein assembly factor BamD|nr:outer membrane protein assembly factor BamD [Bacteroidales bacterium]
MKHRVCFVLIFGLLFSLSSCKFQKLLKSGSVDEKYESAVKLYNEKDYSRALQLFDQLAGAMRATDKSQKISYYYAYCYFNQKDYTLASYYFKRYTTNFPNTPEAEECAYMSAYCNFLNSPEYSLDQTITYEALKDLQLFVNTYPGSKRVSECNDIIDKLREKLELKDYRLTKLYYRMDDYAAAIVGLNNILKEYPDTPHKEEILFLVFKSYHKFAKESIEEKKKERYSKAITAYKEFVAQYPESQFLAEASTLKVQAQKELESKYNKDQLKISKESSKNTQ